MMTLVLRGVPGVGFFGRQQQPDGTSRAGRLNPGSTGGAGKSRAIGPPYRRDTCTSTLVALFHSRQKYYREVWIVVCGDVQFVGRRLQVTCDARPGTRMTRDVH